MARVAAGGCSFAVGFGTEACISCVEARRLRGILAEQGPPKTRLAWESNGAGVQAVSALILRCQPVRYPDSTRCTPLRIS